MMVNINDWKHSLSLSAADTVSATLVAGTKLTTDAGSSTVMEPLT